jgi:hypothetical protein
VDHAIARPNNPELYLESIGTPRNGLEHVTGRQQASMLNPYINPRLSNAASALLGFLNPKQDIRHVSNYRSGSLVLLSNMRQAG